MEIAQVGGESNRFGVASCAYAAEPRKSKNLQMATKKLTFEHFLHHFYQEEVLTMQHVRVTFASNNMNEAKETFTCCMSVVTFIRKVTQNFVANVIFPLSRVIVWWSNATTLFIALCVNIKQCAVSRNLPDGYGALVFT